MYNKLSFTLDNIIYNCTSKGKDDIEIVLPRKTPTVTEYNSKFTAEKSTVIQPAVQIEIKLFLTLNSFIPKLYIHGERNNKPKIIYSNQIELQASTTNLLTFTTTDGGSTWLVNCTSYSKTPSPGPSGDVVTSVNNKKGPTIVLDGDDIHLNGSTGPTIVEQFNAVETKIINLKQTIVSEVTGDVVTMLPDLIKVEVQGTEIIAEKI